MSAPALTVYQNGQNQVSGDGLNTFVQNGANVATVRNFIGVSGMEVSIIGYVTPNDGGQGLFYWNATGTGPDDGGVTNIVPNGASAGCWTRVSAAVGANSVTNAQLAQAPANTLKGNATSMTANVADLTVGQVLSLLQITPLTPQGRLTLSSTVPVMTGDVTAAGTVYYLPYVGQLVPIYDGTRYLLASIGTGLTMTLNASNQLGGHNYDLFAFFNAGVVTIGSGPAWSSAARGTGAGTTQITQNNGLWSNTNAINLTNGATTYGPISSGMATYLGTVYMTGNAQTAMQFNPTAASGGSANVLGVYNAYNRVTITSVCRDSTASWTYATATWRAADASTSNRITFIDGLQQSFVRSLYMCVLTESADTTTGDVGITLDAATGTPTGQLIGSNANADITTITALARYSPQLGLHYLQAMEYSSAATTTFTAGGSTQALTLEMEM